MTFLTSGGILTASEDGFWDARFGFAEVQRPHAISVTGSNLIGAVFQNPTGLNGVSRLVCWDGAGWQFVSDEFHGHEHGWIGTTAIGHDVLFVGGSFTNASGVAANNVAQLEGSTWSALGNGVNGHLNTSAFIEDVLYVGGQFTSAGGQPAENVARWNGIHWQGLGEGVNGPVHKILRYGTNICVFGEFTAAGAVGATNLAFWNGDNWQPVASGVPRAVAVDGTDLYVAYLGASLGHIVRWDGTAWRLVSRITMDPGCAATHPCPKITGTEVLFGELFLAGYFTAINDVPVNGVAKWTGTDWVAAGSGFLDQGLVLEGGAALATDGNRLIAYGAFDAASGRLANGIAEWDGEAWSPLGEGYGLLRPVHQLRVMDTNVLVAGKFESPIVPGRSGVGLWDGQHWTVLDGLEFGSAFAFPTWGTLILSNRIYTIFAERYVARRDDTNWTIIGTAAANPLVRKPLITSMCEFDGALHVGGAFDTLGDAQNNVAKWDGQRWTSLGSGVFGSAYRLLPFDGFIYVDGDFFVSAGPNLNAPVRWDGQRWSSVEGEFPGRVISKTGLGTNLYLAVSRVGADSQPTNDVVRWTGSGWSPIGGVNGSVHSLCLHGGELYAGGSFKSIGGTALSHIGRWDGTDWWPLGSGIEGDSLASVSSIVGIGDVLFVGGSFKTAGGHPSLHFAVWHIPQALEIDHVNSQVRLSWPVTGTNFVLEASTGVWVPDWHEVPQVPAVSNSELIVTQPVSEPDQFYRLRRR